MKHLFVYPQRLTPWLFVLPLAAALVFLNGCASTGDTKEAKKEEPAKGPPLPAGVTLHKEGDVDAVWLAEGFDFRGYDVLYIVEETKFVAIERENEVAARSAAMRALPGIMSDHMKSTKAFPVVTTRAEDVKSGAKALRLEHTIIEYSKGGGAARYFAGLWGAGQPVIQVRGQFTQGDKPVCVFELRRSGSSAGARFEGGSRSDEDIQRDDIQGLCTDFAKFVKKTAKIE